MANDGTGSQWDETDPADGAAVKDGAKQIRDARIGDRLRWGKEHATPVAGTITTGNLQSTGGGEHKAGSAFAYTGHTAPTLRPDGVTALTAADKGRLWCDETVSPPVMYQYSGVAWVAVTGGSTKVATIVDSEARGTDGGNAVAGVWTKRILNTLSDPSSIVTSLAASIFTLPAGTYHIRISAPAFNTDHHQIRLKNNTDTTYTYGTTEYSSNAAGGASTTSRSVVDVILTIGGAKAFQVDHIARQSVTGIGFGKASDVTWTGYGSADSRTEIYTQVAITKI